MSFQRRPKPRNRPVGLQTILGEAKIRYKLGNMTNKEIGKRPIYGVASPLTSQLIQDKQEYKAC